MMSRLALLLTCSLLCATAFAAGPGKVKYVPPDGFAEHKWGDLRKTFDRLPGQPVGVGAAWLRPIEKQTTFSCTPTVGIDPMGSNPVGDCDFRQVLNTLHTDHENSGFYVLSEYAIEGQGFRFGEADPVLLHPVVYQFCATWFDLKREPPPAFDELNKFCGMKLLFKSETREQLEKLPADYVTSYDRVLEKLLRKFGRPDGFARRGQVVIETLEGESGGGGARKISTYRWCPARDRGLHTSCAASVTLAIDPATGRGAVLYSTPQLWEFAYARQNNGFKGDPLFKILHARK